MHSYEKVCLIAHFYILLGVENGAEDTKTALDMT